MGDRTSVKIRCHQSNLDLFEKEFGSLETSGDRPDGTIEGWAHEVNYGGESEFESLVALGLPFVGSHDAGDDYPPMRFCGVEGKYIQIECDTEGEPIIKTRNGKPVKASQKALDEYMKHEKKAEAALLIPYIPKGPFEIIIKVTLQVDPNDVNKTFPMSKLQDTAREAIDEALNHASNRGFNHPLAHEVSIGVQSVEVEESK